jgi:phospholipid/cholesterol/gamma-HCH transport system permease protein
MLLTRRRCLRQPEQDFMAATLEHHFDAGRLFLFPGGGWVIEAARQLDQSLDAIVADIPEGGPAQVVLDLSEVSALDTAGAFLLASLERTTIDKGGSVAWRGVDRDRALLLTRIRTILAKGEMPRRRVRRSVLEDIGSTVLLVAYDGRRLLRMLGGIVQEFGRIVRHPFAFRGMAVMRQVELIGVRAVPIIMVMSFLIGCIVAQQGAFQLRIFGASVFTVDLVGILTLRELAPLLTAIMVAGRSGSAITAELGSMQMREEIDALRVMGLDPVNVLVLPRALALMIAVPILSFLAVLATLAGAMLTLWAYAGIPPVAYLQRLHDAVSFSSFWAGLIKAPFMALIVGLIACTEGMAVRGSAESLGRHTTASVVKAIFMVIVVDGIFAIFYAAINF